MHIALYLLSNAVFVFTFALTIGFYLLLKWKFLYWSKRSIAYVPPIVPIGNIADTILGRRSATQVLQDIHLNLKKAGNKYGGLYILTTPYLIVIDPELIRTIITKEFRRFQDRSILAQEDGSAIEGSMFGAKGMKWRQLRSSLSPIFTPINMKNMFESILVKGEELNQIISQTLQKNKSIEMRNIALRFTTDIILSAFFGLDCNCVKYPDSEILKYSKLLFSNNLFENMRILFHIALPDFLKFFKIPPVNGKALNYFGTLFQKTFDFRIKNTITRNDVINLLIKLQNRKNNKCDFEVTPQLLTAQCLTFFFAGYESSSNTIAFGIYELCINSAVQEKLREEIILTLNKYDNQFTYEAIMDMSYMDKVVKEILRKYPSVPFLNRICLEAFRCPDSDLFIEKGTPIVISLLGLHYDPETYPDPMKFDPERFNEDQISTRHIYDYLPFGEGPRNCIGMRFGLLQAKLGIAILIKNYKFACNNKTVIPLVFDPFTPFLSSKGDIWLNVEPVNI